MTKTIEDLFFYGVFLFDIILLVYIGLLASRRHIKFDVWFIFAYCIANSAVNFASFFTPQLVWFYLNALFTILEYSLFAAFISYNITKQSARKVILILSVCFLVFSVIHTANGKKFGFDSVPIGIETILILSYSFYYMYLQMNIVDQTFIYGKYSFWAIVGFMVYLAGCFFIYILANNLKAKELDNYWFLTYAFYILKNILIFIGLLTLQKNHKRPQNSM